jgi:hypothetical protein
MVSECKTIGDAGWPVAITMQISPQTTSIPVLKSARKGVVGRFLYFITSLKVFAAADAAAAASTGFHDFPFLLCKFDPSPTLCYYHSQFRMVHVKKAIPMMPEAAPAKELEMSEIRFLPRISDPQLQRPTVEIRVS